LPEEQNRDSTHYITNRGVNFEISKGKVFVRHNKSWKTIKKPEKDTSIQGVYRAIDNYINRTETLKGKDGTLFSWHIKSTETLLRVLGYRDSPFNTQDSFAMLLAQDLKTPIGKETTPYVKTPTPEELYKKKLEEEKQKEAEFLKRQKEAQKEAIDFLKRKQKEADEKTKPETAPQVEVPVTKKPFKERFQDFKNREKLTPEQKAQALIDDAVTLTDAIVDKTPGNVLKLAIGKNTSVHFYNSLRGQDSGIVTAIQEGDAKPKATVPVMKRIWKNYVQYLKNTKQTKAAPAPVETKASSAGPKAKVPKPAKVDDAPLDIPTKQGDTFEIDTRDQGKLTFKVQSKAEFGKTTFVQAKPVAGKVPEKYKNSTHYITNRGLNFVISDDQVILTHNKSWQIVGYFFQKTSVQGVYRAIDNYINSTEKLKKKDGTLFSWNINSTDTIVGVMESHTTPGFLPQDKAINSLKKDLTTPYIEEAAKPKPDTAPQAEVPKPAKVDDAPLVIPTNKGDTFEIGAEEWGAIELKVDSKTKYNKTTFVKAYRKNRRENNIKDFDPFYVTDRGLSFTEDQHTISVLHTRSGISLFFLRINRDTQQVFTAIDEYLNKTEALKNKDGTNLSWHNSRSQVYDTISNQKEGIHDKILNQLKQTIAPDLKHERDTEDKPKATLAPVETSEQKQRAERLHQELTDLLGVDRTELIEKVKTTVKNTQAKYPNRKDVPNREMTTAIHNAVSNLTNPNERSEI